MRVVSRAVVVLLPLFAGCNRCWESSFADIDVGIGTRDFIWVPDGEQVSPEIDDEPYFNVALRGYGIEGDGLTVTLEAFVEGQRYADDTYTDVSCKCRRWGVREVGALRLHLDPAALPPQVEPDPPLTREPVEIFDTVDTGWWYEEPVVQGDVQVVATVTESGGRTITGETWWFVYR